MCFKPRLSNGVAYGKNLVYVHGLLTNLYPKKKSVKNVVNEAELADILNGKK